MKFNAHLQTHFGKFSRIRPAGGYEKILGVEVKFTRQYSGIHEDVTTNMFNARSFTLRRSLLLTGEMSPLKLYTGAAFSSPMNRQS